MFFVYQNDLKKGLPLLSEIGNLSPIVGFPGTVIGMISSFGLAKTDAQFDYEKLSRVEYLLGKRVSRRLVGDYLYNMNDAVKIKFFEDTVAEEVREIDVHHFMMVGRCFSCYNVCMDGS